MNSKNDENTFDLDSLPWGEVLKLVESDQLAENLASISTETLEFVVQESNYQFAVESALKSLSAFDPEKANLEYAAKLVDKMKEIASGILVERNQTNQ